MIIELLIVFFLFLILNPFNTIIENVQNAANTQRMERIRQMQQEREAAGGQPPQRPLSPQEKEAQVMAERQNSGTLSKAERRQQKRLQKKLFDYITEQDKVVSNFEAQVKDLRDSVDVTSYDLAEYKDANYMKQEYDA
tara:strand:- start:397 stop:810 length:414 start_codon:yes stop_codon:yes gene_type:complete